MRIVSAYHDYYDPIMRTAMDPTVLYLRETADGGRIRAAASRYELGDGSSANNIRISNGTLSYKISYHPISFCGTLHHVWMGNHTTTVDAVETQYRVTGESSSDVRKMIYAQFDLEIPQARRSWYRYRSSKKYDTIQLPESLGSLDWTALHRQERSPILTIRPLNQTERRSGSFAYRYGDTEEEYVLVRNPRLEDLNFVERVDPFTAFQEINMYISGVLGQSDRPMVKLTDKDILTKHGFDPKWGFRKMPEHKGS